MPFGSQSAGDILTELGYPDVRSESPMPFGSQSAGDNAIKIENILDIAVTNAFRQSVRWGHYQNQRRFLRWS